MLVSAGLSKRPSSGAHGPCDRQPRHQQRFAFIHDAGAPRCRSGPWWASGRPAPGPRRFRCRSAAVCRAGPDTVQDLAVAWVDIDVSRIVTTAWFRDRVRQTLADSCCPSTAISQYRSATELSWWSAVGARLTAVLDWRLLDSFA